MKVPQIGVVSAFSKFSIPQNRGLKNKRDFIEPLQFIKPIEPDVVSFTSNSRYLKKYGTLPDEIRKILTPQDAIDMFKDMEWLERGVIKRGEIGEGTSSKVYRNPWLKDYYLLILTDTPSDDTITIFSGEKVGDAIWQDKDNGSIQILRRSA